MKREIGSNENLGQDLLWAIAGGAGPEPAQKHKGRTHKDHPHHNVQPPTHSGRVVTFKVVSERGLAPIKHGRITRGRSSSHAFRKPEKKGHQKKKVGKVPRGEGVGQGGVLPSDVGAFK